MPIFDKVLTRLHRDEGGFGLIELVIAMTVLNVGLLALVASLNSGALALSRATRISTAATLADARMELYRALPYVQIRIDDTTLAADSDSIYTGQAPPWDATKDVNDSDVRWTACGSPVPTECDPKVVKTGPDGHSYRIDTYIIEDTPAGFSTARAVKYVTVIVRDANDTSRVFVRQQSTFDQSAG